MSVQLEDRFDEIVKTTVIYDGFNFSLDYFERSLYASKNIKYHIIAPQKKVRNFIEYIQYYLKLGFKIEVNFVENESDIDWEMNRIIKTSDSLFFIIMQLEKAKYSIHIKFLIDVAKRMLLEKKKFAAIIDDNGDFLSFNKLFENIDLCEKSILSLLSLKDQIIKI